MACGARTAPFACIGALRSRTPWCTYETVGWCRTISANVTESRMKTAVKTKVEYFMQTLHLMEKVCIKSACQILADVQTFLKVCTVCKTQTFFIKVCIKSAQSLQSLHMFCI